MITIKRILCPVDFSTVSDEAVVYAESLATLHGASVHLLHVVSPTILSFGSTINTSALVDSAKKEAITQFSELKTRLKHPSVIAGTEVRVGDVFDEIKSVIKTIGADLLVMGTHGRHGLDRWFMGSTTEKLLRHSPIPMITISAGQRKRHDTRPFQRIVVTTDFSDGTSEALSFAFSVAQENQSKVTLLHVINDAAFELSASYRDEVFTGIQKQLEDLVPAHARHWCEVETRIETGLPYREILNILKAEQVGLLVMNIHRKGMLDRALIGSTAEKVVRGARCPVLLIPSPKKKFTKATPGIEKRMAA